MSTLNNRETLTPSVFIRRSKTFVPLLLKHLKSHAITWALLVLLFLVVNANYRLGFNLSPSLPYKLMVIHLNEAVETGGLISFRWHGGKPWPDGTIFTKRLLASPGETVIKKGRDFVVGGRTLIGKEIGSSKINKRKLFPNDELNEGANAIPLNKYFVAGDHEHSLDSRYNALGLVDKTDVIGRTYPIF